MTSNIRKKFKMALITIYQNFLSVHGDQIIDVTSVMRWLMRFFSNNSDVNDMLSTCKMSASISFLAGIEPIEDKLDGENLSENNTVIVAVESVSRLHWCRYLPAWDAGSFFYV